MKREDEDLLIQQAKLGKQDAFTELYDRHHKLIRYIIYDIVKNEDVADDLLSVTFTKAFSRLESYVNPISFEMWLKTIAINTAIDYIRRNKKEQLNNYIDEEDSTIQLSGLEHSPEDNLIFQQNINIVMDCIPRLKKKYRDLIYARLDGKSYQQISEELAIPEATVKTCLNKARQRLREMFNKY